MDRNKIIERKLKKGLFSWEAEDRISIDGENIYLNIED